MSAPAPRRAARRQGRRMLPRSPLRILADCAAILVVHVCATLAFAQVFGGTQYLWTGIGSAVLGIVVGVVTTLRPLRGWLTTLAGVVVAFTLFGPALAVRDRTIAGFVPTLDAWRELFLGVVFSWRRLLTAQPPAEGFPGPLIVPCIVMLVCSAIATVLALRLRRGAPWAMLPGIVALVVGIVFGTKVGTVPVVLGVVVAAVCVLWTAWRLGQWRSSLAEDVEITGSTRMRTRTRRRRALAGVAMVVGAVLVGSALAGPLAFSDRRVLRDVVEPPVEVRDYPSPLAGFRGWLKLFEDEPLLTVSGMPEDGRLAMATLDFYDGTVYAVAGAQDGAASGEFTRVGDRILTDQSGRDVTIEVEVEGYEDVWVPSAGYAQSIAFQGPRAQALQSSLSYNGATGTAIAVAGVEPGDAYTVRTRLPEPVAIDDLEGVAISDVEMPEPVDVPDQLQAWVTTWGYSEPTLLENIVNLQQLMQGGAFSHGLEGDIPSLAGHGAARIDDMFRAETLLGDDEQYAAAFALALSFMDVPSRVVLGFHPGVEEGFPADGAAVTLTGGDLRAWVEIPFEGYGWVAFDPTPPEDNTDVEPPPMPEPNPRPQVLQPPQPPEEPAELTPGTQPDLGEAIEEDEEATSIWLVILAVAGLILGILLLLALPFVVMALLKRRRRRRRREAQDPATRLAGGWHEVVDQAVDLGLRMPRGGTRREAAVQVAERYPDVRADDVSAFVDAGVFGPETPPDDSIGRFWKDVERTTEQMRGSVGRRARILGLLSVRSFLRREGR